MNDLFLLNDVKVLGTRIRLTGENEAGKLFSVEFSDEDFAAYFEVDHFEGNKEEEDVIRDAAQSIYDAWVMGHTSYEVYVVAQKLKGYQFKTRCGKFSKVCKSVVGPPNTFMDENDYISYTPIYS